MRYSIVFVFVTQVFVNIGLGIKLCSFTSEFDSEESTNTSVSVVNVTSGGSMLLFFEENQTDCSVSLDLLYEDMSENINKQDLKVKQVVIEVNFQCGSSSIHFVSNASRELDIGYTKIYVSLFFGKCDIQLEELQRFLKFGNIWSISESYEASIDVPSQKVKCEFAETVRGITSRLHCNVTQAFFWESCLDTYNAVIDLSLIACKSNHIPLQLATLKNSFPNIQSLYLENIELASPLTFPWTHSFYPKRKDVAALPSETEIPVIAFVGRGLQIFNTSSDIGHMLYLNGSITFISINLANMKSDQDKLFTYVSDLQHLDLSYNNLSEISEHIFDQLFELLYLNLKHNNITNIPKHVFEKQSKLVFLDLSENCLKQINRNLLKNLVSLQELHLEHNRLQTLPKDIFKEQIYSLKFLYLHSNPIITIPDMPFYGRHIELIDIHSSYITGASILDLVERLYVFDLVHAVSEREHYDGLDIKIGKIYRPELDLTFCQIKNFHFGLSYNKTSMNFLRLTEIFDIKLEGNPISCKCKIYFIIMMLRVKPTKGKNLDWVCMYPDELRGMTVASITEHDVYCPVSVPNCPTQCSCYERIDLSSLIIDCRNKNISTLPRRLPKLRPLELWFKNTNLSVVDPRDYFLNVSVLDVSQNKLSHISPWVASQFKNISVLRLEDNDLTSLPVQIKFTNLSKISLARNPFICDCHTKWMSDWLHDRLCPVTDWNVIKCTDNNKTVREIINVPESMFVCTETEAPSIAHYVIFPSIIIGSILFVIVILSLLLYFQRFTVKVLLYVICGFRGCINFPNDPHDFKYDCVIIYAKNEEKCVYYNIIRHLQANGYIVGDMYKDSVIGFTFVEGIMKLISHSRHVIFCMTEDCCEHELVKTLWNVAYDRAMNDYIGSLILVTDDRFQATCKDENINVYLKNGRYINMESRLLIKSIEYLMPRMKQRNTLEHRENDEEIQQLASNPDEINLRGNNRFTEADCLEGGRETDIYVLYPDELHRLVRYDLIPFLRENKQSICVLHDDIIPGNDITEIIHTKLDQVKHIIFILSNETLETLQMDSYEGTQLGYILPNILNKAFISSHNYLLLLTYKQINVEMMPRDLKNYINTYITASVSDNNFKDRLLGAVMFGNHADADTDDEDNLEVDVDIDAINLI